MARNLPTENLPEKKQKVGCRNKVLHVGARAEADLEAALEVGPAELLQCSWDCGPFSHAQRMNLAVRARGEGHRDAAVDAYRRGARGAGGGAGVGGKVAKTKAPPFGIEPKTLRLTAARSDQLSYGGWLLITCSV